MFEASLRSIAWEGRIVVVGFASGTVPQIPANLLLVKNAVRARVLLGQLPQARPRAAAGRLQGTVRLAPEGRIRPHVSQTLPLAQAADAVRLLIERRSVGKVVVTVP